MIYALIHFHPERTGLIGTELARQGQQFCEVRLDKGEPLPNLREEDGVVIMGGPMSVNDEDRVPFLTAELKWVEAAMKTERPILGVCLGAQILAKVSGARVTPMRSPELGWGSIQWTDQALSHPILEGSQKEWTPFHWHGEAWDLPFGAQLWASSKGCQSQAFYLSPRVIGFQFHIEMTNQIIDSLLRTPEAKEDLKRAGLTPGDVVKSRQLHLESLRPAAENFFQRFFRPR